MIYKSLYLDPNTHDIVFENGNIRFTDNGEITLQKIKTKLLFFKGDFFLDEELGVDYLNYVFEKNVSDDTIKNLFLSVLQRIPEISEILNLEVIRNREEYKVSIFFEVKDRMGNVVEGEV